MGIKERRMWILRWIYFIQDLNMFEYHLKEDALRIEKNFKGQTVHVY